MILDRIHFTNFGVYGGSQTIDLTPTHGKPVILIGALNGGGKTTFLDAVQLVLYGPRARCSNRGRLGYKNYLQETIHRGADPSEGAGIQLDFRRTLDGVEHRFSLNRHWRIEQSGLEESVSVLRDGEPDTVLSEHWQEYIESYIPSGISYLFFFDAEQISNLAEGEHAAEILGSAIHSLLGLDLVERLQGDLLVLERRKKKESRSDSDQALIQKAEEEEIRLQELAEAANQHAANLKGELNQLIEERKALNVRFKAEGGELFESRKQMEAQLAQEEEALSRIEVQLRELAAGPSPLLLIPELLDELAHEAEHDIKVKHAIWVSEVLEERDRALLAHLHDAETTKTTLAKLETFLSKDREARNKLAHEPSVLDVDDEFLSHLKHLRSRQLPEIRDQIRKLIQEAEAWRERIAKSEAALSRVPDADAIATLQREIQTLQVRIQKREAEHNAAVERFTTLHRQFEEAAAKHTKLLDQNLDSTFQHEDRERLVRHAEKVRSTLAEFRKRMIAKHAQKLETLMLESFSQLLRKRSLVKSIHIDPESFEIQLTGSNGADLPMNRLSAGERQLLATALLWGLARASGRPIPTIIDTPLGRLDSEHRKHLVERYFPVASHQVILLSTDEEIDERSLEKISKSVSQSYSMIFDEALQKTHVTKGYFWNHETTC